MVSAGRILILPKGDWSSTTTYAMLDLVSYNGIAWLCRRECLNQVPSDSNVTYWQKFGSSAPIATTSVAGIVMPDGTTIEVDENGVISVPIALTNSVGLVKPDGLTITIDSNGALSCAVSDLESLTDVTVTSVADGQTIVWNAQNQRWQNGSVASTLEALTDTLITSPANGQYLKYNGTKWVNASFDTALSTSSTNAPQTQLVTGALTDALETIGSGASKAYSVNDTFLATNGHVYKATTAITQNQTLTVGGNCALTDVNGEITSLNSRLTTSNNQQFRFGYDSTSDKYGYILESGGADTFVPFSSGGGSLYAMYSSVATTSMQSISLEKGTYIAYGQTTAGTGSSYVNKNLIPVQYPIGDISVTNGTIEDSTDEQGNSCSLITMSSDGSLNFRAYSWGSGQGATAIAIIKIA